MGWAEQQQIPSLLLVSRWWQTSGSCKMPQKPSARGLLLGLKGSKAVRVGSDQGVADLRSIAAALMTG